MLEGRCWGKSPFGIQGRTGLAGAVWINGVAMSCSERCKEIKRRRHRRKKLDHFKKRLAKATVSEKAAIVTKIRDLTPGAETIVHNLSLAER